VGTYTVNSKKGIVEYCYIGNVLVLTSFDFPIKLLNDLLKVCLSFEQSDVTKEFLDKSVQTTI
ncbi:hypothetical protein V1477_010390, partial [Vespula maculifrons]